MSPSPRSHSVGRPVRIVVGAAVVAGVALAVALPTLATPPRTPAIPIVAVAPAGSNVAALAGGAPADGAAADGAAANGAPELGDLVVPEQPAGCQDAQVRERDRQLELLAAEQAAEVGVIGTVTDGSAPAKLAAIRDRADAILARIADLDGRCTGTVPAPDGPADPEPGQPLDEAPADDDAPPAALDRVLVALEIACGEVDFGDAPAAAADRAAGELDRNGAALNDRLAAEFPRFARRVGREADPELARTDFTRLAEDLAGTLENRRGAILDRADAGLSDRFADTCEVVEID